MGHFWSWRVTPGPRTSGDRDTCGPRTRSEVPVWAWGTAGPPTPGTSLVISPLMPWRQDPLLVTYVDDKYEVDRIDIKNDSSLWEKSIKGTGHNKDVIVGTIYKPPKDNYNVENINTFTTEIENVIHELDRRNSEILIAGDYNINLLNLDVRQAFSDFLTPC